MASLSISAWGIAAATLIAASLVGLVAARMVVRALRFWSRRTDTRVDDEILVELGRPITAFFPQFAAYLGMPAAGFSAPWEDGIQHALVVTMTLNLGWIAFRGVRVLEAVISRRFDIQAADNLEARSVQTQMRGFRNIAGFLIGVVTIGLALLSFQDIRQVGAGLLASAGIAGIVLGFAAQRSISTIVSGLQIAIAQPIRVDDVVIVEGEWGRIEEVTLTYVVVRIWDLRRLVVPVNYFIERPFQNWTRTSADLLSTVKLFVDYSVPVDALREELKRILDASPHWDQKVWGLQVIDSTERTMVVRALMSAPDASAGWDMQCEVRERLIDFVRREFPHALPHLRAAVQSS